jgi:hypothetical protein
LWKVIKIQVFLNKVEKGGFETKHTSKEALMITQEASKYDAHLHHNQQVITLGKEKMQGKRDLNTLLLVKNACFLL